MYRDSSCHTPSVAALQEGWMERWMERRCCCLMAETQIAHTHTAVGADSSGRGKSSCLVPCFLRDSFSSHSLTLSLSCSFTLPPTYLSFSSLFFSKLVVRANGNWGTLSLWVEGKINNTFSSSITPSGWFHRRSLLPACIASFGLFPLHLHLHL